MRPLGGRINPESLMNEPNVPDPRRHGETPSGTPESAHDSAEEISHGAHGRYGIEEEPIENAEVEPHRIPRDPDEIERNAARDAETRRTGEDLG
jgi:hypothetical protein